MPGEEELLQDWVSSFFLVESKFGLSSRWKLPDWRGHCLNITGKTLKSARLRKYWSRWRKTSSFMERGPRARNSDITHIHPISGASPGPENRDKTLFITLDTHTHKVYFYRNTKNWFSIWKRRWSNPLSPRPCVSDFWFDRLAVCVAYIRYEPGFPS